MQRVHFTPFLYKPFVSFGKRFFNHATTFLTLRNITYQFNRMMVRDQWTSCVCMGAILIWNLGIRHYKTHIFCTQNRHQYLPGYGVSVLSILDIALYLPYMTSHCPPYNIAIFHILWVCPLCPFFSGPCPIYSAHTTLISYSVIPW